VAPLRAALPGLAYVLLVDGGGESDMLDFHACWGAPGAYDIGPTSPDDMALLHFTSGTTGRPKGAIHVHHAVLAHTSPARSRWTCTRRTLLVHGGPGWVTGTSYGIISPLTHGLSSVVDEADFDAERWYRLLAEERVTVWYTAPTAVRMLMKAGDALPRRFELSALRFIASVGEPLNPEAVLWGSARWPAHPRQLVADGDGRHHGLQLRRHGREARLHGPASAGVEAPSSGAWRTAAWRR